MPAYVLVDRGQSAITHKHHNRDTLAHLAWIECTNDAITIPLGNPKYFHEAFSPQELRAIYKASTGFDLQGFGTSLAIACHELALRMPESVVNPVEARMQFEKVMDGDRHCYQYQPGMNDPIKHPPKSWCADPIKVERNEQEEKRASAYAPSFNTGASAAPAGGTARPNPFSVPSPTPREPGQPRSGGVREIVFKIADEIWEKSGKPTDLKQILELRKTMMNVLESEHSVKRTTSSTTLGAWQKERIS